ncbi:MAG TPA: hypothetical protein VG650_05255 [Mycobacteriales bacterium]|nr:hypothetical protein [Mycobacteriales bacterium]HWC34218.1 hypothetical protein [Mycobacteriales bacterium]
MEESVAEEVVERLRAQRIFATVNRRVGVYNVGLRVVIPDGREAIWDNDGAAGLEAMVLRDGVLVGFVPQIPDSDDLDAEAITAIIANTDYDAPPPPSKPANPTSTPARTALPPAGKPRWTDRLRRSR